MSEPETLAGQELLLRHPGLGADEIGEVERQARGQETQTGMQRRQRVIDRLRHLMTPEQIGAASAVALLDPDAIDTLDDDTLRFLLDGFTRLPLPGPEERKAAAEETRRFLDEIM